MANPEPTWVQPVKMVIDGKLMILHVSHMRRNVNRKDYNDRKQSKRDNVAGETHIDKRLV